MLKLGRRARGHFVTLIEIRVHLIRVKPGHISPSHELTFLGFILNSLIMTVRATLEKAAKLKQKCLVVLTKIRVSIHYVSEVIGLMVSMFPGVEYAQLFY